MAMPQAVFLLPAASRFGAQSLSAATAAALGRADHALATDGRRAQLLRHFPLPGDAWPIAALSRQADVGDAAGAAWLRADPAFLRPDINGVRLIACGEALALEQADVDALLPALRPLFGDAGFLLDAPQPSRWYLRLPPATPLPVFADPGEALGDDLFEHLDTSPQARRWRVLANEAQIVLHNHPWNAQRTARGRVPVNALWFWGAGALPPASLAHADAPVAVYSDDATARALGARSGVVAALPARFTPGAAARAVVDLAASQDLASLDQAWLHLALQALQRGELASLVLDDEAGHVVSFGRWQRLRLWRGPRPRFGA